MFKRYSQGRCYVIAEIGGNFTALEEARRLVQLAAASGVDAVKLQTYRADTLASKAAMFDMENTGVTSQYDVFKKYEIGEDLHREVFEYAESLGLDWFSTPSHETDVEMLERLGVGAYKIGSDDAVNISFLRQVARLGKPILLSTGMCTLEEVREAVDAIVGEGNPQLILLHAITSYPTLPENVNLRALQTLKSAFPALDVGYSDHTVTPTAALCAVAMGATVIEKHFTYDKSADGPDHRLSADPEDMKWLVEKIREFEVLRGDGIKRPAISERTTRINNRKSLVLRRAHASGERLTRESIAIKRPGYGIAPKFLDLVIGREVGRDLEADRVLTWDDLQ